MNGLSSDELAHLTTLERELINDKTFSIINLVAYILLLITTGFIGLNVSKDYFSKKNSDMINFIATLGLLIVWIILIIAESIKINKVYD